MGAVLNFSKVNKSFFLMCNNYRQLRDILQSTNCSGQQLSIQAMANGGEGMPGNPALAAALATDQGQRNYAGICRGRGFTIQPRPRG